jgi:putative ABC transport system permease protein
MSWVVAAIALVIGAVGVANTMAMSILERRGEIGALRAIGWPKRRVILLILIESVLLAVAGAATGTVLGLAIITGLSHWRMTAGLVQGDWPLGAVATGSGLTLAMAVLGAAFPAWHSASAAPVEALRSR